MKTYEQLYHPLASSGVKVVGASPCPKDLSGVAAPFAGYVPAPFVMPRFFPPRMARVSGSAHADLALVRAPTRGAPTCKSIKFPLSTQRALCIQVK